MGYTLDVIKGVGWIGALRITTRVVAFVRTAILARLLTPSQFGVFGVATLVLSLLEVLLETGVNVVLIQEKDDIDSHINSAWIISIIRGIVIGLAIYLSAPYIADFFNSKDSLDIIRLISTVPFIRGFINPSVVKFQKNLLFGKEFRYRLSIYAIDASVAVISSFILRSPVGIVFGLIAGAIYETCISFFVVKPVPRFVFEKQYLSKIFSRGKWVTLSGIFNYLFYNFDNVVVGRMLGTSSLGLYQMAYSFSFLPISEVTDVFSKVTFPVYTRIASDKKRLRVAFLKTTLSITFLTVPVGFFLFLFPKEIILIFLGEAWIKSYPILQALAIFGVLRAISGSTSSLFLAVKKQNYVAIMTFVNILGLGGSIVILIEKFGLAGAAYSPLVGTLLSLPFILYFLKKIIW